MLELAAEFAEMVRRQIALLLAERLGKAEGSDCAEVWIGRPVTYPGFPR